MAALDKHTRIADLFDRVADLTPPQRRQIYDTEGTPDEISMEVESLLSVPTGELFAENLLGAAIPELVTDEALEPGMRFGGDDERGDYEIVREIARGGMGAVFEARQLSLGRTVALKVILGSRFASDEEIRRFRAEAEAVARLEHPGIVPVYEVGENQGEHFFSMAFLGGGSLAEADVPMAPREAARMVEQIADAVHYAHARNVVHRDLKPANILLTDTLSPKVSDFGIAKDTSDESVDLTRPGVVLGTPGFLAPEQARGDTAAVGPAADVYGLGAILYYLLTGRAPIEGDNVVDILSRVLAEDPKPAHQVVAGVPQDLASIAAKCLEKSPDARYGSARAVQEDLERFLADEPVLARHIGTTVRLAKWCRRRPAIAASVAVSAVAVIAGVTASTWFGVLATRRAETVAEQNVELRTARDAAMSARGDTEAFARFLVDDVISSARPKGQRGGQGRDLSVRDALLVSTERIGARFAGRPIAEALARHELGVTLRMVGETKVAEGQFLRALELRREHLGEDHDLTLASLKSYSSCLSVDPSRRVEALDLMRQLIELDPDGSYLPIDEMRLELARYLMNAGQITEGRQLLEELYPTASGLCRAKIANELAALVLETGENERSVQLARETIALLDPGEIRGPIIGYRPEETLAEALRRLGRVEEAEEPLQTALSDALKLLGPEAPPVDYVRETLCQVYDDLYQMDRAAALTATRAEQERKSAGETDRYFELRALEARYVWELELSDRATEIAKRSYDHLIEKAPSSLGRFWAAWVLSESALQKGRAEDSFRLSDAAYRALTAMEPLDRAFGVACDRHRLSLATGLYKLDRFEEALEHQPFVVEMFAAEEESPFATYLRVCYATSLRATGNLDPIMPVLLEGLRRHTMSPEHPVWTELRFVLGTEYFRRGNDREAIEKLRLIYDGREEAFARLPVWQRRVVLDLLSKCYESIGDKAQAAEWRAKHDDTK